MRRIDRYGLWLLLVLAAALRLWTIGEKNLWLDESNSWDMVTGSIPRMISWTASDIHPPLYYVILKAWVAVFGDSLAGMRSLSVVCSVLALYLLIRLIDNVLPRPVAYVAVLWCVISPYGIYYAQEARMYAAVTAAVLGACLAYRRWVDSGFARTSMLVAYACCVAVALYLHYFAALAIAAMWVHFVSLAVRRADLQVRRGEADLKVCPTYGRIWTFWLLVHAAVAIAYLPWISTAVAQITRGQAWRQPVALSQIPDYAAELSRRLMFGMYWVPYVLTVQGVITLGLLAAGLIALGISVRRSTGERGAFFLCLAVVPVLLGLCLLPRTGHMDLSRYLPFAPPLIVVAAARGLTTLARRPLFAAGLLIVGAAVTVPSLRAYYDSPSKDSDARPIVSYLEAHARGNDRGQDPILIVPGYVWTTLTFISRANLDYVLVNDPIELAERVVPAGAAGREGWVVVDYRWPAFQEFGRNTAYESTEVPGGRSDLIRLYRVRVK